MEPFLTINPEATLARIKADERTIRQTARLLKVKDVTLYRILSPLDSKNAYPFQYDPMSRFQEALRKLKAAGYLVESGEGFPENHMVA